MDKARRSPSPQLESFQFEEDEDGEELESGSNERLEGEEDYDAINDETFGRCEPIDNADLETLAARAKLLDFGDEPDPVAWPDPSSIPLPTNLSSSMFDNSIWGYNKPSTSKRDSSDDFFSFITSATLPQSFDATGQKPPKPEYQKGRIEAQGCAVDIPKVQYLTEEDILRKAREEERPNLLSQLFESAKSGNGNQKMPLRESESTNSLNVMSLLEVAQKSEQANKPPTPQAQPKIDNSILPGYNNPPPGNKMPYEMPMVPPGFPPPKPPMPLFNGQMHPMLQAIMMGKIPPPVPLPPGMTPQHWAQMAANMFPPLPPPGMPPPMPSPFMNAPMPPQQQHHPAYHPYSQNRPYKEYRERKPNLPSTKTISDFAFDPYAGLMSKKEREWLIKIQLIQCMGTGDPWDDDYYYALWKDQNVLAKAREEWAVDIKPKYYTFHDTYPSDKYVPPVFNGSLGRPTHVSTAFPRQIIDLHNENGDEDDSQIGKVNNQKKLRTVLLRIENASLALLECRDVNYKQHKTEPTDVDMLDVRSKVSAIVQSIVTPDKLPTIMLIQKGRLLVAQLLAECNERLDSQSKCLIITTLVETLPLYSRKVPADANVQPLQRAIVNGLWSMDLLGFKQFRESFPIKILFAVSSKFSQQLCLSLLIGFVGRGELNREEQVFGTIGRWLSSESQEDLRLLYPVLNLEAVELDLLKLFEGLSLFPQNSIGYQLSDVLKLRIKHRPS
ncbi:unnamed protein product [Bursaphelenchus okinawaensis]|uniref:PAT1 domain-containing protein n=1 Tax=Bursaphelenchus okinawaensis TaxID=465554 RepID=A0A811K8U6_9BILA|nr:unnamed protein product [Bursaphelenchus okinawaensis]CAG9095222.1 unnamed protein product [Bursaphelenchus okinawaensis]